jgi:hypothetical protein
MSVTTRPPTICRVEDIDVWDRLAALREKELVRRFPRSPRSRGLLRIAMIKAILRHKPTTIVELLTMIPAGLLNRTDPLQFSALPDVAAILARAWTPAAPTRTPHGR